MVLTTPASHCHHPAVSMPLEVIGAGWGRTGTLSLAAALESLGYPCYHMVEVLPCGHSATWLKAVQSEQQQACV